MDQTFYVKVQNTRNHKAQNEEQNEWIKMKLTEETTTHTVAMKRIKNLFFLLIFFFRTFYTVFYILFLIFCTVLCFDLACVYTILIDIVFNATEPLTFFLFDSLLNVYWLDWSVFANVHACIGSKLVMSM